MDHDDDLLKHLNITHCGHCGNKSQMEVVASHEATRSFNDTSGGIYKAGVIWELVVCPVCSTVNLRQVDVHWGVEPEIGKRTVHVVYPSNRSSFTDLPSTIDSAYQAACNVRHIDTNAFAVLLKRVIEGVCLDRKTTGNNLYERLNDLVERNEIPLQLHKIAYQLCLFGNSDTQFGENILTSADADLLNDLCGAILKYVYVAPQWIKKVENRLDEVERVEKWADLPLKKVKTKKTWIMKKLKNG